MRAAAKPALLQRRPADGLYLRMMTLADSDEPLGVIRLVSSGVEVMDVQWPAAASAQKAGYGAATVAGEYVRPDGVPTGAVVDPGHCISREQGILAIGSPASGKSEGVPAGWTGMSRSRDEFTEEGPMLPSGSAR